MTPFDVYSLRNLKGHIGLEVLFRILEDDRQVLIERIKSCQSPGDALKAAGELAGFDYVIRRIKQILEDIPDDETRIEAETR